jgi:hypothetical protein
MTMNEEIKYLNRSVEQLNRVEALANAVRHRLKEETPEQVVAAAQKYFEFLQGTKPAA